MSWSRKLQELLGISIEQPRLVEGGARARRSPPTSPTQSLANAPLSSNSIAGCGRPRLSHLPRRSSAVPGGAPTRGSHQLAHMPRCDSHVTSTFVGRTTGVHGAAGVRSRLRSNGANANVGRSGSKWLPLRLQWILAAIICRPGQRSCGRGRATGPDGSVWFSKIAEEYRWAPTASFLVPSSTPFMLEFLNRDRCHSPSN
jgi:hypothetical protein